MAILGRRSAPRRARPPAAASVIPAAAAPVDCSAWVIGGLWPAELTGPGERVAELAEHLQADLERIVATTNARLAALASAELTGRDRGAAEAELTQAARQFAIRRVASTVRQLHRAPGPTRPAPPPAAAVPAVSAAPPRPVAAPPRQVAAPPRPAADVPARPAVTPPNTPPVAETTVETTVPTAADPAPAAPPASAPAPSAPPAPEAPPRPRHARPAESEPPPSTERQPVEPQPAESPRPAGVESDRQRLQRLLAFVARQQPALGWQVGITEDRGTVLATDLAHGWIPPGVDLPAGVRLPAPGRHPADLLGPTTLALAYRPGDRVGPTTPAAATETALTPRHLAPIPDLSRLLTAATETRPGLPRLANTLVKAAAAGTGVAGAEIDLLRVQLDTLLYRLIGDYPREDAELLADCVLLAAATGIATGDALSANYHFAWFQALTGDSRPASQPAAGPGPAAAPVN